METKEIEIISENRVNGDGAKERETISGNKVNGDDTEERETISGNRVNIDDTEARETISENRVNGDDTSVLENITYHVDGEMQEEIIGVNNRDDIVRTGISKDGLITGAGIVAVVLLIGALVMLRIKSKRKEQSGRTRGRQNGIDRSESRYQQNNRNGQKKQRDGMFPRDGLSDMATEREAGNSYPMTAGEIQIGKIHHVGRRSAQQDSLGVTDLPDGVFAVVADGMGGLKDGDKVSQTIVMTMLQEISAQTAQSAAGRLFGMVAGANDTVNRMLGVQSQYTSGSTVVAVLAGQGWFEWISVGDSRICLYRGGRLIQLNREHNYESELLWQAVNGEISFAEAWENPKRKSLTSFIGMGKLKYIDGSTRPVKTAEGDCVLLMSDGVFNTLSDEEICTILQNVPDPQQAAEVMEERILAYDRPKQDNFTAVILKF